MKLSELIIVMLAIGLIAGIGLASIFSNIYILIKDILHGRIDFTGILIGLIIGIAITILSNKWKELWSQITPKNK